MKLAALLLLVLGSVAWLAAQQTAPATRSSSDSAPTTRSSSDSTTRPSMVLEPVKEGTTQPAAPEAQYREGTFLVDQVGRLTHNKKAEPIFVFEKGGKTLQLTLMANSDLARMEDAAAAGVEPQFRVTGMMTEYRGKNYLLVDRVVVVQPPTSQSVSPGS
ncbi:MAG TPA: hypothetical protein VK797_19235 [Tepidisphaeraceae bacterium]|nr:hypothetical protein [Tepidisphaeraceae bacterium]